ncbi:Uncharacterised protein [Klebsiella pneumoniae]|uniref:hypothetical protein n=1 Tax=Klebsiella pneumoniae TaxID=573 RepID=UPI000E2BAE09|nr:hypothetical protein [Klebsiella pneumoniae]SWQ06796.1 Uncharacterised protein [Klebsiella pneumoniae]
MPTKHALGLLSSLLKEDKTFVPVKHAQTRRWHVSTVRGEFEILGTGIKWYDTHAQQGGGGAIDLAMHLLGLSFVDAVNQLLAREGRHGADRA